MAGDIVFIVIGFALPLMLLVNDRPRSLGFGLLEVALISAAGAAAIRYQGLWSQRVIAVRMIELSRIPRAFVIMSLLVMVIDRKATMEVRAWDLVVASAFAIVGFVIWRSAYRVILAAERRHGRMVSRVVMVGTGRRTFELCNLFNVHPELGMRVVSIIGDRDEARRAGLEHRWAGPLSEASSALAAANVDLVIICSSDLDDRVVRDLTRAESARGRTLYVDAGLPGVDFRRLHSTAIAHQPLFEVQGPSLPVFEQAIKRAFDVAVAGLMTLLFLPIAGLIAAAIKIEDGGPVFFKQRRVGLHSAEFGIFKFRTMVVDAEARLAELKARNERRGPLFKMDDSADPRITRVGRLLRALSLDEMPQLFNVLRGEMSLVGPRPALPSEVGEFPADLMARHEVRPGITGLWQVEARDNASFEAYRRLDLFYVENWSTALDMTILIATVDHVLFRPLLSRLYRKAEQVSADAAAAAAVDDSGVVAARSA